MLHPLGPLPSVVYWRRRILLLAPIVLVVLTLYVACSSGPDKRSAQPPPAGGHTSTAGGPATEPGTRSSAPSHSATATSTDSGAAAAPTASRFAGTPASCAKSSLKIAAATSAPSYHVGDQPVLYLQAINASSTPCVQDLADPQIELTVYNGAARVWGSHDCLITPGTSEQTLPIGQPIRRSITWTGLSSQPQCAGTRQRVGPGRYTLHAKLSGVEGTPAQFSIS